MQQIIDLLNRLFEAVVYSVLGFYVDTDTMIFQCGNSFVAASATASPTIELPSHAPGWIIDAIWCEPTAVDFTVDIARSGRYGAHLTAGQIYSTGILPKRSTMPDTILGGFAAESKEVFTFNLVNGSTASNPVKIFMKARKRR